MSYNIPTITKRSITSMNTKDVKKFLAELQQHLNKATDSIAFF